MSEVDNQPQMDTQPAESIPASTTDVNCPEKKSKLDKLFIAWIVLFVAPIVLTFIGSVIMMYDKTAMAIGSTIDYNALVSSLNGLCALAVTGLGYLAKFASYVIGIVLKCTYPKEKKSKIAFWLSMVSILLVILTAILTVVLMMMAL